MKWSKNIAMNTAMSCAASSVVPYSRAQQQNGVNWELCTHNSLVVISVREPDADRLVDEEDVRIVVPGVPVVDSAGGVVHPART